MKSILLVVSLFLASAAADLRGSNELVAGEYHAENIHKLRTLIKNQHRKLDPSLEKNPKELEVELMSATAEGKGNSSMVSEESLADIVDQLKDINNRL